MSIDNLYYYRPEKNASDRIVKKTVIVYGATPAGITAAIQAVKMGASAAIAEFSGHVGGITANGLGATDFGAKEAIGGLSREFYERIGAVYGKEEQWTFEPKEARRVFENWLAEYGIPVYLRSHLKTVEKEKGKIKRIRMENGDIFEGEMFIDASYEGDLMAKAGVTYTVGREGNSAFRETYNGVQFGHPHHNFKTDVDPYKIKGDKASGLLPGIQEELTADEVVQGSGDKRIQAYNFRITMTKDPSVRVPVPKPPQYDAGRFELLLRYIQSGVWDAMNLHTMMPNGKTDLNNYGGFSTDNIGMNYDWPDGSYEERESIFQDHVNYNMGMLYFLANDKRVPEEVRNEVAEWGLAKDEFTGTGHWPPQLYIRESRRMKADYVMTDHNCLGTSVIRDSIGLASYGMDSHHCRRVVLDGKVVNEGDVQIPIPPYPISFRSIRPKEAECENLAVPVCLSSSHIAYGSLRMEPVFMVIGQSAGAAAALAAKAGTPIQKVPYEVLRAELTKAGQVLEWDDTVEDDPVKRMLETFGAE